MSGLHQASTETVGGSGRDHMKLRNLDEAWTTANGHHIFYRRSSDPLQSSPPALVHISGVGMSGTYMLPTADILAEEWQTFVPDLPGLGRSPAGKHPTTIESLADRLAISLMRSAFLGQRSLETRWDV